jgi:stage V sporulation protein AA
MEEGHGVHAKEVNSMDKSNLPAVPTVYIRFRRKVHIPAGNGIRLGQIAQIIADPGLEQRLLSLELYRPGEQDGNITLVDMMLVVRRIRDMLGSVQIEYFGEPHVLVEIVDKSRKPNAVLIVLVWLLLFIGSGLAIMNFHADVSMAAVHRRIYQLVTGNVTDKPYLLQIPYSLGIGAGMVLFFNHLFKKKFNEEPSPLEVEMFLYQESMNRYMITEEYMKLHGQRDASAHDDNHT